jgi:hypothetical protein
VAQLDVICRYFSGGIEEGYEKHESGLPVPSPRFETGTSQFRSRSAEQSAAMFDADGEDALQVRRTAANVINKKSRTADKGWYSRLGVGRGANNTLP